MGSGSIHSLEGICSLSHVICLSQSEPQWSPPNTHVTYSEPLIDLDRSHDLGSGSAPDPLLILSWEMPTSLANLIDRSDVP